jgi:hypothetical protein
VTAFEEINGAMEAAWRDADCRPTTLFIPLRVFIWLRRPYMTKRGFRRWRAKLLAQSRRTIAEV